MNEQAIQDAYNLFVANGYKKSIDDFKKLIASNEQALNDSYALFTQNGYKKSINDFKGLMGLAQVQAQPEPAPVKKKEEPVPSSMELPSEGGRLVSPKPSETVTVGPMGMTGLQRTAEYQPAKEFEGKGVGYVVGDLLKTAGKGVVKFPADVLETASIVTAGVKNLIAKTGAVEESDASKFAIYKGAQEYKKLLDEVIPTDRDISSGFWGQTAKAIGEMVPIILSGFASGGAKAITTAAAKKGTKLQSVINYGKGLASRMATPQGALTISQVAAPSYEQAKSEGATENEALTYAIQNALVSYPIEMLPVDGLFKRLDKNLVGNKGVEILKRAVIGGSEEAITEGIQNVYENVSANQIYGTTKEMLDGVGDASAVGGTVGAIMNGLLTALLGRRAKATTNEEKAELDKSIEEVKTKVDKINSNNEKFIETINTLEQSNPRTLTYGSAEYNFIESPDGNLELAEDDMTKEQAEGIINNLSNAYKKIQFSVEEVEPESPYKPTTYKVIGKPIKTEEDAIQKQAAGEVPVQPTAGISETMEEGKPQAESQGVTEEGKVQEEIVNPLQDVDKTTQALRKEVESKGVVIPLTLIPDDVFKELNQGQGSEQIVAEAYHKAKEDNSNPELIKAVEELLTQPEVSLKTPEITRDIVRSLTEEQIAPLYDEVPMNLLPAAEGVTNQDAVYDAYVKAKSSGKYPNFINIIEKNIYETLPTQRLQPEFGTVQPSTTTATQPTGLAVPSQPSSKREEIKSSIQRIANAGLLRSAETGKATITEQEIDAQMALTDAMSRVWEETTGKNDFYETFFDDVKEGDVEAIKEKGGALFQNVELPQRPISRVTLGVFELPEFQKMKGMSVAPQSVSDLMKSRGKQIEKDIVNTVLGYDKYKGQKRISFDEFKDDVETQLMKLERIDTRTYASYGRGNLGDNHEYGTAQTIIFNSPIDHGQYGHFRADFTKGNLAPKTWTIRQIPNTEQYVAIDADMPSGVGQNEMAQYVGTAGPKADVEKWIEDRNSITDKEINKGLFGHIRNWFNPDTGVYTLAELQSDYFQKNKANDLYASRIPKEEVDEYINKNFRSKLDDETVKIIKDEFGLEVRKRIYRDGNTYFSVFKVSDPNNILNTEIFSNEYIPPIGYTLDQKGENRSVVEALRLMANGDDNIAKKRKEIIEDYKRKNDALVVEENKYITKRIEEIKKSDAGNLMINQFVASQKVHELRLFREALKHAADKGATELWFPTPYTLAVIEGYVSTTGDAPYEVLTGDESMLEPGDTIDYGGTEMTILVSNSLSIEAAPSDNVSIYDIDELRDDEARNRMDELEYDLSRQVNDINAITREEAEEYNTDEFLSEEIFKQLKEYFENNPEEETVSWGEIEDDVSDYVSDYYYDMSAHDLLSWAGDIYQEGDRIYAVDSRRSVERFGQPSEYESNVDEDNFESELSEEQYTVVKKYEELGQMMKKIRPDAEVVTDNNGKSWLKTAITEADASNPIIAFQEEGGKIKGAIDFSNDNKASVYIFDGADISTLAHEISGHLGRRVLEKLAASDKQFAKDYETAKKWAGVQDNQWTRGAEEKWARAFERYLMTGKSPNKALTNVFQKLRDWLANIYKSIKGSSIDIELTPEIIAVFDNLLATKGEQLMTADTKNATVLEKVLDFLDKAESDLDKFGRETAGINLPIPVIKAVIKSLKALVKTGITLQEAIKRAAAQNNVSEKDVVDTIEFLSSQRAKEAKPEGVSEIELPGYNRMIGELEGVIEKSYERGADDAKALDNAISYLQGSKVYENASDTQREKMVRDVRNMFGKREKSAPKPEKLFGDAKDVNQITMSEYELLKKQLRDTAKGARNAISLWRKTANALTSYLKKMVDGGHISMKQSASVLRKFSGVNLFDEKSIGKFVDYMERVFKNAAYVEQIEKIKSMLPTAKKNLVSKLGVSESLIPLLSKLFAINPTLIPDSVFGKYTELVEMIGQRKAVLELKEYGKVLDTTEEILDAVDEETLKAETLAEVFDSFEKKVLDDDGKVNFAETLKRMLDDGIIKQDDAEIMRKYKSMIVPRETREKKSEEELAAEKKVLVETVKEADIDSDGLAMKDERDQARELQKLIKTDAVERLDNATLNNLLRVVDNINNGYFPHYGELMIERLNAINNSGVLEKVTETAEPYKIEEVYAKLKSMVTDKDKFSELVRRKPLYYMEQAYGNFDSKAIFESLLEQSAQAQAAYVSDEKNISSKLEKAEEDVAKSLNQNPNKTLESKFKMMTYMIQLEHDSNPGSKQVNQAKDFLEATIKHIKNARSTFGERDAKFLERILNNKSYQDVDGQIDANKLYKTFNPAEKKAIKVMQDINADMRDKAIYTASVIRGNKIKPLNNYIHLNVLHEYKPEESLIGASFVEDYNRSLRPSTRAKSLIERTGDVSALNFDVFASVARGSKYVLMDYYLTEPVRTARKTINETRKRIEEKRAERDKQQKENPISEKAKDKQDKADQIQRDVLNSMDNAYEEAVDNVLASNFTDTSFFDKAANYMSKQGYRAVLASLPRFAAELSSNLSFVAIAAPKQMGLGIKNRDVVMSADMPMIMKNVKSTEINRLFPHDTLSGRLVDTSILEQASGIKGSRAKNDVANKIQQIYNLSLKKYLNPIELMADAIVSSPDKLVMRPLWYGTFIDKFKKETGKDLDEKKVAENDEKYMAANKEALDAARKEADRMSILAGATDNAFLGVLKGRDKQNQSVGLKLFNTFNNFMTNFLIYEYTTARIGLMAAMGNGSITKKQGYALMAAVATRMTTYTVLMSVLGAAMLNLFVDDEDADDEKTLLQKIGQAMASSMTSIFLGRDFGNATKAVINQGVEYGNEKFLDFLRKGEYDPYKDAIQYTIMPPERKGKQAAFEDMIMNMMGPFGPSAKTAAFAFKKATESPKKEAAAIERSEKEKQIRLPLEVLGNLGMIPLYKDVRKIVNKQIYKDLDNAEKKPVMNKIGKEDMKKYFPDLYNEMYGPGGAMYDMELMRKEMNREKARITREMKDEMYNYTPK